MISNKDRTVLKVVSRNPFNILGDIDILLKLNLHGGPNKKEDFEGVLPKEVQRILYSEAVGSH